MLAPSHLVYGIGGNTDINSLVAINISAKLLPNYFMVLVTSLLLNYFDCLKVS